MVGDRREVINMGTKEKPQSSPILVLFCRDLALAALVSEA